MRRCKLERVFPIHHCAKCDSNKRTKVSLSNKQLGLNFRTDFRTRILVWLYMYKYKYAESIARRMSRLRRLDSDLSGCP